MNITQQEVKTLIQYQLTVSLVNEYFKWAEPILRKIEADKYPNRQHKRKAMQQYDKDIKGHKRWILGTANILERTNEDEADSFIDKASVLLNEVKIINHEQ